MLALLCVVIIFHVLVLIQVIPYAIVWAGRMKSVEEMVVFEGLSIAVNVFLIVTLLMKGEYLKTNFPERFLNGIIWFFAILFAVNTIGNLFSKTVFELVVFTPLTFISAFLCWQIVRGR